MSINDNISINFFFNISRIIVIYLGPRDAGCVLSCPLFQVRKGGLPYPRVTTGEHCWVGNIPLARFPAWFIPRLVT